MAERIENECGHGFRGTHLGCELEPVEVIMPDQGETYFDEQMNGRHQKQWSRPGTSAESLLMANEAAITHEWTPELESLEALMSLRPGETAEGGGLTGLDDEYSAVKGGLIALGGASS